MISYDEALRWASNVDEFKLQGAGHLDHRRRVARPDGRAPSVRKAGARRPPARPPNARDHALRSKKPRPRRRRTRPPLVMLGCQRASCRKRQSAPGSPAASCDADDIDRRRSNASSGIARSTTAAWRAPRRGWKARSGTAAAPASVRSSSPWRWHRRRRRRSAVDEVFEDVDELRAARSRAASGGCKRPRRRRNSTTRPRAGIVRGTGRARASRSAPCSTSQCAAGSTPRPAEPYTIAEMHPRKFALPS